MSCLSHIRAVRSTPLGQSTAGRTSKTLEQDVSECSTVVLVGDKTREIFQPFRGPGYPFAGGGGRALSGGYMRVTQESGRRLSTFRLGASTASRCPHSLVAFLQPLLSLAYSVVACNFRRPLLFLSPAVPALLIVVVLYPPVAYSRLSTPPHSQHDQVWRYRYFKGCLAAQCHPLDCSPPPLLQGHLPAALGKC